MVKSDTPLVFKPLQHDKLMELEAARVKAILKLIGDPRQRVDVPIKTDVPIAARALSKD